jgi:secreted trypsin-like serine protease
MKIELNFFYFWVFIGLSESQSCGDRSGIKGNIVNGNECQRGDWPWITAFVHVTKNTYFCGGSLISSTHILSGKIDKI